MKKITEWALCTQSQAELGGLRARKMHAPLLRLPSGAPGSLRKELLQDGTTARGQRRQSEKALA